MSKLKSILVIDDHQIVFSGIQLIFHACKLEFEMQNCKNGDEAVDILRKKTFDLVIMDVNLPDTDTYHLLHLILGIHPEQTVLIFSMSSTPGTTGRLKRHLCREPEGDGAMIDQ